ncbi:unnamed protein product [Darwinula stevensoni]|uniref:Mitogen-activated protein kinase kinase kinase kinase n=1 Tax=Darwinula stevensoni TaxID=69355 RepID=A0A7R8X486_9CRUS|nr:unnamed protein product [Darwinula stevensoni]CAG0879435.1 unnamed protein product [Darwinula stevensoni]
MASARSAALTVDISERNPQNDYELIQRVGCGTYGDVYKAKHIASGDFAAIKIMKLDQGEDFSAMQMEIKMMKECRHPNIVAYYGSYLRKGKLWICMEYCGGGSLQDIYHVTGPLTEPQIAFICRETLKGLEYLHSKGKIHRDIKGANILLTETGDVKLADFGVSAQITATLSKRKSFIGTPYWMAPEVAAVEQKGGYNQQCDIWALGITAIELAELQPPMFDLHPMRALVLMAKSSFKPPTLKDKNRWSPEFQNFIKVALTKNPKKRPTASLILTHAFLQGSHLNKNRSMELLQMVNSPQQLSDLEPDPDEETVVASVPHRITSKRSARDKERTRSELRMGSLNFEPPLVTELSAEPPPARYPNAWGIGASQDTSAPPNNCKENQDEEEEGFDIATSWMESDGNKEEVHKGLQKKLMEYDDETFGNTATLPVGEDMNGTQSSSPSPKGPPKRSNSIGGDDSPSHASPITQGLDVLHLDQRALSDSENDTRRKPTPPPREKRERRRPTPPRVTASNGLPPTPKVHMGAGFTKVFNGCPLRFHCSCSWVHPTTRNQHILFGAEEGIYTLNLQELHEGSMDLIYPRKTTWLFVIKDVLMSISGKTPHLYSHDLIALHNRHSQKFTLTLHINRIPERFVPKRFAPTLKVPETKNVYKCCVSRNPYNGYTYLCGAIPNGIFLMQWYDPLHKFMLLKTIECFLPVRLKAFEMIITPDLEYPMVCVDARKSGEPDRLKLDLVNLNSTSSWVTSSELDDLDGAETVIPRVEGLHLKNVTQLDRDTILVCYDNLVQVVDMEGQLKTRTGGPTELAFDFHIDNIVCLTDSILAFHKHGMQGRNIKTFEITQEITDPSHIFRLLGHERSVVVESRAIPQLDPTLTGQTPSEDGVNLYILLGHENTL